MFSPMLSLALSALCGCAPLFLLDSSNFGDVDTVKRHLLDETWEIQENHYDYAERADYSQPFEILEDALLDTPGTLYFGEDSEVGRRELVYTDPEGGEQAGVFILEADVDNDNPMIAFEDMDLLFADPLLVNTKWDVTVFEPEFFELHLVLEDSETRHRQTLSLTLDD